MSKTSRFQPGDSAPDFSHLADHDPESDEPQRQPGDGVRRGEPAIYVHLEENPTQLAELIREVVAPEVELVFDTTKPDGMPRKLLDVSRLTGLGWRPRIGLREGIEGTYRWFLEHRETVRERRSDTPALV